MELKVKKVVIFGMILGIIMLFSNSYAEENNQEVQVDKSLWNQAVTNVRDAEDAEKRAKWESLSPEEKYNSLYKDYIEILIEYHKEAVVLVDSLSDSSGESISSSCYNLMTRIDSTSVNVTNLATESKYAYSKEYLYNSYKSLKTIANYLDTYDLYIVTNDAKSAGEVAEKIKAESNKFIETFTKAYNYYVITQGNGVVSDSLNQTEDTFYKELTKNFNIIKSSYDMLEEAHGLIKKKKNGTDLIKKVKKIIKVLAS